MNVPTDVAGVTLAEEVRAGKRVLGVVAIAPAGKASGLLQVGSVLHKFNDLPPPEDEPMSWFTRMLTQLPFPRVLVFVQPILEARPVFLPPLWEKAAGLTKPAPSALELFNDLDRWSISPDLITRVLDSVQTLIQQSKLLIDTFFQSEGFKRAVLQVGTDPSKDISELYFRLFDLLPFRKAPESLFDVPLLERSNFPALYEFNQKLTLEQRALIPVSSVLAELRPLALRIKAYRNFIKLRTKTRRPKRATSTSMFEQLLAVFTRKYTRMVQQKIKVYASSEFGLISMLEENKDQREKKLLMRAYKLAIRRHDKGYEALTVAFAARFNSFLTKLVASPTRHMEQKVQALKPAHLEATRRVLLLYSETLAQSRTVNEVKRGLLRQKLLIQARTVYVTRALSKLLFDHYKEVFPEALAHGGLMMKREDTLDMVTELMLVAYKTSRIYLRLNDAEDILKPLFEDFAIARRGVWESRQALQTLLESLPASTTPEHEFSDLLAGPLKTFVDWYKELGKWRFTLLQTMTTLCMRTDLASREVPDTFTFMDDFATPVAFQGSAIAEHQHVYSTGHYSFCTKCGHDKPELVEDSDNELELLMEEEEEPVTVIEHYEEDKAAPFALGEEDEESPPPF